MFIVTAPLLTHGININMPKGNARTKAINNPIALILDNDLQLLQNEMPSAGSICE
jgi:biopolymer transport protein ExbD